jgi:hypothetical protein
MTPTDRARIHELIAETDPVWALSRRSEYLSDLMADVVVKWWYERSYMDYLIAEGKVLDVILCREAMDDILKQIVKHQNELYYRREAMEGRQSGVTADEVRQAKTYPFEELHPFIHGGKNPQSFQLLKDNTARCHVCNWRGDTIAFVVKTTGKRFADAVRSLQ